MISKNLPTDSKQIFKKGQEWYIVNNPEGDAEEKAKINPRSKRPRKCDQQDSACNMEVS